VVLAGSMIVCVFAPRWVTLHVSTPLRVTHHLLYAAAGSLVNLQGVDWLTDTHIELGARLV
jgi:hypothetical protein